MVTAARMNQNGEQPALTIGLFAKIQPKLVLILFQKVRLSTCT